MTQHLLGRERGIEDKFLLFSLDLTPFLFYCISFHFTYFYSYLLVYSLYLSLIKHLFISIFFSLIFIHPFFFFVYSIYLLCSKQEIKIPTQQNYILSKNITSLISNFENTSANNIYHLINSS